MIILRGIPPIAGRDDVWFSELRIKTLLPARRDKLTILLNLAGYTFRDDSVAPLVDGEVVEIASFYKVENSGT